MTRHQRVSFTLLWISLILYAVAGLLMRPIADDFCELEFAQELGAVGGTSWWYQHWSGRISLFAVKSSLYSLMGATLPAIAPVAQIIGLVGAWTYALSPLTRKAALIAVSVCFGGLASMSNIFHSFYWASGSLMVHLPLICMGVLMGALLRKRNPFVIAVVAFVAAGFYEPLAFIQAVVLALVFVVTRRRDVLVAFIATVVSIGVGLAAPGTASRASVEPLFDNLVDLAFTTLRLSFMRVLETIINSPVAVFVPFTLGIVVSQPSRWKTPQYRLVVIVISFLLIWITIAPTVAVLATALPRTYTAAQFIIAGASFMVGSSLSFESSQWQKAALLTCITALCMTISWSAQALPLLMTDFVERQVIGKSDVLPDLVQIIHDDVATGGFCKSYDVDNSDDMN